MTRPSLTSRITFDHLRAIDFWQLVDVRGPDECWTLKSKSPDSTRYGVVRVPPWISGVRGMHIGINAHRVALSLHLGQLLPPDRVVDHLCYNPPCMNPAHLELVTQAVNIRRARRSGTVHIDTP